MRLLLQFLFVGLFLFSVSSASDVHEKADFQKSLKSHKLSKRVDGRENISGSTQTSVRILTSQSAAALPGAKIGTTAYNYQTNDNLHDRIVFDRNTGTIHAQWMYGDIAEVPGFSNRRMYYNYFNGSSWLDDTGIPIENQRAGYGALAVDPDNIAVPASHHTIFNEEASNAWYDFSSGLGFFTKATVWETRKHGALFLEPFWPDIAIDEQDVWYVTATNNNQDDFVELVNGVNDNILYWRSTNRGATWSEWKAMFPDTIQYPLSEGASGPNEAGSHQIAVSDNGNGKVGILVANPGNDFYFFESQDRGVAWNDAIQLIGNKMLDAADSLTNPILWDIITVDTTGVPGEADTLLYPWTKNSDSDEPEANVRPRPQGPADLFYLNGEPHVVWNETIHTVEGSYYPNGYGITWTNPGYRFLNGDSAHVEGGFSIKHWSPSTGVSYVYRHNEPNNIWSGNFQQYLTMPQIGADNNGTLYCVFTKCSESDTLKPEDGVTQNADDYTSFGPLSFGRIWGAKSDDGGKTWYDAGQLIPEADCIHQNLRYIGVADYNNNAIHILYQNTPNVAGSAVGADNADHTTWAEAEMRYWAVPTSAFPATNDQKIGAEIELATSSKQGGIDFGYIGDAGSAKKSFTVNNIGDQDLVVSGILTGHESFKANPSNFTVAPGASQEVEVTFQPTIPDTFFTYLAILNNDPSEESIGIPLEGSGIPMPVSVQSDGSVPGTYELAQNYPNPFNPTTHIAFSLKKTGQVRLAVYNTLGEELEVLVNKKMNAGTHTISWTPARFSSGIYFYQLITEDFRDVKKMVLMQ
ncbi:hypothetical protein A2V82_15795 [candidate division KSB1 bacterium RBG_16_48_16]|nr:MAG: hypothetical protein A2V82_15795 [candidate division KSB1 bacterium RBG_16_48_16]